MKPAKLKTRKNDLKEKKKKRKKNPWQQALLSKSNFQNPFDIKTCNEEIYGQPTPFWLPVNFFLADDRATSTSCTYFLSQPPQNSPTNLFRQCLGHLTNLVKWPRHCQKRLVLTLRNDQNLACCLEVDFSSLIFREASHSMAGDFLFLLFFFYNAVKLVSDKLVSDKYTKNHFFRFYNAKRATQGHRCGSLGASTALFFLFYNFFF